MKNYKLFFILSTFVISIPIFLPSCSNGSNAHKTPNSGKTAINSGKTAIKTKNNISNRLKLFGVSLQNPNRTVLEDAIKRAGLIPIKESLNDWCDSYKVTGQLGKASRLYVCYTQNDKFAYAQYFFPAFMNINLVKHVIAMVSDKYGKPGSVNGDYSLGDVTAYWHFGSNEEIKIFRGWPSTSVYLNLINIPNHNRFLYELHKQKEEQTAKKAKSQGNAF
jgi:hypothetical protein